MAVSVEERVARLEGQVTEQAGMLSAVLDAVRSLESRMDARLLALEERMEARFTQMEGRFTLLEGRFNQSDARFTQIDERFVQIDARFLQIDARFLQLEERISLMDAKMSRQFTWLVGLLSTLLIAVIGACGAVIAALV